MMPRNSIDYFRYKLYLGKGSVYILSPRQRIIIKAILKVIEEHEALRMGEISKLVPKITKKVHNNSTIPHMVALLAGLTKMTKGDKVLYDSPPIRVEERPSASVIDPKKHFRTIKTVYHVPK